MTDFESRYGWRAYVESDFAYDGIRVNVGQRTPTGMLVMNFDVELEPFPENTSPTTSPLHLQDGAGRALLDALARHYGGVSSARMLREDYDHERRRVDKLTDALIGATLLRARES